MIQYQIIEGLPEISKLQEILELYQNIFSSDFPINGFIYEVEGKKGLLFNLAYCENELVGFKIGFEKKLGLFYSWLGGIKEPYRSRGIAKNLMDSQHRWLKENNYTRVKTKTGNEFKGMLILNLKNGFDITGTNLNKEGKLRLVLQKKL